MKTYLAAITLTAMTGFAHAADMPRYNVEQQCDRLASMSGDKSAMLMNSCMDMEQSAYNNLKQQWANIPENIQKQCNQLATLGVAGSYTVLEQCVKMESDAVSKPKQFQF